MTGAEAPRQPQASTSMPTDKVDNIEYHDHPDAGHEKESNSPEGSGGRSPVSSPSPNIDESRPENKTSRKREREISVEPGSISASKSGAALESDFQAAKQEEQDYTRTPAKKNRIHRSVELDAAAEEDGHDSVHHRSRSNSSDDTDSNSPPTTQADLGLGIAASPPQEMKAKVRQISQGVEDLTWRNIKKQRENVAADGTDNHSQKDVDGTMTIIEESGMEDEAVTQSASSSALPATSQDSIGQTTMEGTLNLKRKHAQRGPSADPSSELEAGESPAENLPGSGVESSIKRPRDDSDKDDNPRVPKRPTPPPPEEKEKEIPIKQTSPSGFMAYASTSSPFASVKGQNIFSSSNATSSSTLTAVKTPLPSSPVLGKADPPSSAGIKRTGFEAFASSSSPFASVASSKSPVLGGSGIFGSTSALGGGIRARSPARRAGGSPSRSTPSTTTSVFGSTTGPHTKGGNSAFNVYATGGVHGFSLPLTKRARGADDPEEQSTVGSRSVLETNDVFLSRPDFDNGRSTPSKIPSFGEKLRAAGKGSDEDVGSTNEDWDEAKPKVNLSEQEVSTGEELEETIHQVRGKLFALSDGAWRERGSGILKLNVRAEDGGGARLVMRKEAVYTLLLNVTLFAGMKCTLAQDPRYLRFSVIENGQQTTHYNLRLMTAKVAAELMEAIHENLPSK
ncbi:hypothetical protein C8R42DRAFT_676385 [Lentinula raphanica]|nr:hypothetical protein C8R42DRAFT_676385 [Lentinula raphanica]